MNISEPVNSSFTIITGDKTEYSFNQVQSSTTSTTNWMSSSNEEYTNYTWKLTEIKKTNGAIVRFDYAENNVWSHTRNVSIVLDHMIANSIEIWKGEAAPDTQTITSNDTSVNDLRGIDIDGKCHISFHYSPNGVNSRDKLDSILIIRPSDLSAIKKCYCTYAYSPGNRRILFLKNVRLSGIGEYTMDYVDENSQFPAPDTYATDWYGYYNGRPITIDSFLKNNIQRVSEILESTRISDSAYAQKGLLKTIHYPAGGRSTFTYEANTYSLLMGSKHQLTENRTTGGVRIKQIDTFAENNIPTQNRVFIYEMPDGLSSGVLLQKPDMYMKYSISASGANIGREILSTLNNIGFSKDSHIEYLKVIEERRKSVHTPLLSKTEYKFNSSSVKSEGLQAVNNYSLSNEGINGNNWTAKFTITDSGIGDWLFSSNTFIGKKPQYIVEYNDKNKIVSHKDFQYSLKKFGDMVTVPVLIFGQAGTHEYNLYSIYQSAVTSKSYDENAQLIYNDETSYAVDSLGRINSISRTNSRGNMICDVYSYLTEVPAYPTEMIRTDNGKVVSATKYDYIRNGNSDHYVLTTVRKGAVTPDLTAGAIQYRMDCRYDFFDSTGHPWEMTDKNAKSTCYIWGYEGQHLIAKIENMTYDVMADQYGITNQIYSSALPERDEDTLRGIEGLLVTTYTYEPLIGITRITDPTGHSIYYDYDDDGKLRYIRDDKGKILKSYDYHIVTDNQ